MELPITTNTLRTMVAKAREIREKEFQELVRRNLLSPRDVLAKLQIEITESVFRQDKLGCFRITAGVFPHMYKRFGDTKQVQKELWDVLEDYLQNFPSANRILETDYDGGDNPVACRLILCFNLPWTPPVATQTNSHPQPTSSHDASQSPS